VCDWVPTHPRRHMRARSVGVDRVWLGSQAFGSAKAFNANIGAWNTASVSNMAYVCAALSGPGGAPPQAGRVRRVFDARACVQTCGHANARVSTCVGIAARTKVGSYVCL
jgi:surface protein